jgi:hypothetical protein
LHFILKKQEVFASLHASIGPKQCRRTVARALSIRMYADLQEAAAPTGSQQFACRCGGVRRVRGCGSKSDVRDIGFYMNDACVMKNHAL